ncbi:hypothetical protein ACVN4T_22920 [Escherichia coli]
MKQMSLIEMDGFLKGKCIPSDLKVNETNAEYLVRKFGELESKLETALRECRSAGITIDNLEAKCEALAAENAVMRAFGDKLYSMYKGLEASGGGFNDEQSIPYQQAALDAAISEFEKIKTTETDAFLAELLAHGVELFAESQKEYVRKNRNELDSMTRAAYCGSAVDAERFAAQLRKGGNQ